MLNSLFLLLLLFQANAFIEVQVDSSAWISGSAQYDVETLKARPRAIVGYLSDSQFALVEFLCMMHMSWLYISSLSPEIKLDLIVLHHPRYQTEIQALCKAINLDEYDTASIMSKNSSCYSILYDKPDYNVWFDYPFVNNVHFFGNQAFANLLYNYGYVMKSDFDVFLTPSFLTYFPDKFAFGLQEFATLPETQNRLKSIASKFNLVHKGIHNIGPAWYGDARELVALGNNSLPILLHIVTYEFEQKPTGGIAQNWAGGEGWPLWSAGIAALYATEITANHMFPFSKADPRMDMHTDSTRPISEVFHIHTRHGSGRFSKHDFAIHRYNDIDLSQLDVTIIQDYATYLACFRWRELLALQEKLKHVEL